MKTIAIRKSGLTGAIVIVFTLGLMYWLDHVQITWRRHAIETFTMKSYFYFSGALLVLFAILIIFLIWFVFVFSRSSWFTTIFCLLGGTIILAPLFMHFSTNPVVGSILNFEPVSKVWYVIYGRGFESMILRAGAFIFVAGWIDLVRRIRTKT